MTNRKSSLTLLRNEKEAVTVFAKGAVMGEKVRKSKWGMPRLSKAMKDVVSCEKPRGLANTSYSADVRMGQPDMLETYHTARWANPLN